MDWAVKIKARAAPLHVVYATLHFLSLIRNNIGKHEKPIKFSIIAVNSNQNKHVVGTYWVAREKHEAL